MSMKIILYYDYDVHAYVCMIPRYIASFVLLNGVRKLAINAGQSRTPAAIHRLKNPQRGGQNLSYRYRRLEKTLRGKEALSRDIGALAFKTPFPEANTANRTGVAQYQTCRGFHIPERPKPPQDDGMLLFLCINCN